MFQASDRTGCKRRLQRTKLLSAAAFILAAALDACGFDFTVATSYDQSFPDKWTHAASGAPPYLSNRDTVYAEIPWRILVLFNDYGRDYSGNVDISFSYKILKPDGTLFYDTTGISAVSGAIAKGVGVLLSHRIPIVTFSPNDKSGKYTLIATAADRVTKAEKTIKKNIILLKYPRTSVSDFTDISFNVWVHSYCLNPDPARAVSAFSYFIGNPMSNNDEIFWPVFYFFQCLYNDNPVLIQKLAATLPKSTPRLQEYSVFLFRALQLQKSDISSPVPDSLWNKFERAAATGFGDPFTDAFAIRSGRLIESAFYYYGSYSLIRFLIDCLGTATSDGYERFIATCKEYSDACPRNFDKATALQFYTDAKAILKKTFPKNPLINSYCRYSYANDHLEASVQKALKEVIAPSDAGR